MTVVIMMMTVMVIRVKMIKSMMTKTETDLANRYPATLIFSLSHLFIFFFLDFRHVAFLLITGSV